MPEWIGDGSCMTHHRKPDHAPDHVKPPPPTEPDQYKVLCISKDHTHIDQCWLSGWMAGHTAGYTAAREDQATRLSLREAQAQIAELRAEMAKIHSRLAWDPTDESRGDAGDD